MIGNGISGLVRVHLCLLVLGRRPEIVSAGNGRKQFVSNLASCMRRLVSMCVVVVGIIVSVLKVATKVSFEDNEAGLLNASRSVSSADRCRC